MLIEAMARLGQSNLHASLEAFRSLDQASPAVVFTLARRFVELPSPEYRIYCAWLLRSRYGSDPASLLLRLLTDEVPRVNRYTFRLFSSRRIERELIEQLIARLRTPPTLSPWHARNLVELISRPEKFAATVDRGSALDSQIEKVLHMYAQQGSLSTRLRAIATLRQRGIPSPQLLFYANLEQKADVRDLLIAVAVGD